MRLRIFLESDNLVVTYGASLASVSQRKAVEASAREYILGMAPQKYHHFIVPTFPLGNIDLLSITERFERTELISTIGCKRRIFDPNYLESLNASNITLLPEGIQRFDETGIVSESGQHEDFDVIVLATGFQVTNFLTPMKIIGKTGGTLADQWNGGEGAQAYFGTYVHNFPNFAIM